MPKNIRRLYAIATKNGLVERGNRDDLFHLIIYSVTGKTSVKELGNKEIRLVEAEILKRAGDNISGSKIINKEAVPDMMTPAQQSLAWRLMYQIQSYDLELFDKTVGERLAGVVWKELGITASDTEPLKWVNKKNGNMLIEILKRYVTSAEQKYIRHQSKKS